MNEMHVRVRLGGEEQYALPVQDVRSIAEVAQIAPLPGAPDCVLGVQVHHGQLLPVFDLATLLELEPAAARRIVVVERTGHALGFAVAEVLDVAVLSGTEEPSDSALLSAAVMSDGALVGVIDVAAVVAALEAEVAA